MVASADHRGVGVIAAQVGGGADGHDAIADDHDGCVVTW